MKVVFVSNFFNHHQKPFCDAMYARLRGDYAFIETVSMNSERKALGWGEELVPMYVKRIYQSEEESKECELLIMEADVVISGSAPEHLLHRRIKHGKLLLRYSERPLKRGLEPLKYLPRLVKWHLKNPFWKPIYTLCASAYTAGDYARFGLFKGKAYKWGYFPETKHYTNIEDMLTAKKPASILWVARFLDLKHPEIPVQVAQRLKKEGYAFTVNLIGIGKLQQSIQQMIAENDLADRVHMLGAMKPEQVRKYMEQSEIFLFTSDRHEGWGAVLNESMNSGCATVASDAIGSVPFLLKNKENGLIYNDGDFEDVYTKVKFLLDNPDTAREYGRQAYYTITDLWNAENAADRLLRFSESLLCGEKHPKLFLDGPCSRAEGTRESWFIE